MEEANRGGIILCMITHGRTFGNASQCTAILGLKNARQFHAFVFKIRSGMRINYKIVTEDDGE